MLELYLYFVGMLLLPLARFPLSMNTVFLYIFWPIVVPIAAIVTLFKG